VAAPPALSASPLLANVINIKNILKYLRIAPYQHMATTHRNVAKIIGSNILLRKRHLMAAAK